MRRLRRFANVRDWYEQNEFFAVSFQIRNSESMVFRFFTIAGVEEEVVVLPSFGKRVMITGG